MDWTMFWRGALAVVGAGWLGMFVAVRRARRRHRARHVALGPVGYAERDADTLRTLRVDLLADDDPHADTVVSDAAEMLARLREEAQR